MGAAGGGDDDDFVPCFLGLLQDSCSLGPLVLRIKKEEEGLTVMV